ncbi:hypothetical protein B0H10DRAFT_1947857 [Mycena sp. CBHHK59/15]|nr:hypothetical protein B0H10DRAFT_1947857 [Mycena sp. CBHHK59/15]
MDEGAFVSLKKIQPLKHSSEAAIAHGVRIRGRVHHYPVLQSRGCGFGGGMFPVCATWIARATEPSQPPPSASAGCARVLSDLDITVERLCEIDMQVGGRGFRRPRTCTKDIGSERSTRCLSSWMRSQEGGTVEGARTGRRRRGHREARERNFKRGVKKRLGQRAPGFEPSPV